MTALIGTGHSIDQKNDEVKGSFRPEADMTTRFSTDPAFSLSGRSTIVRLREAILVAEALPTKRTMRSES